MGVNFLFIGPRDPRRDPDCDVIEHLSLAYVTPPEAAGGIIDLLTAAQVQRIYDIKIGTCIHL